jgi:hypothetical protein
MTDLKVQLTQATQRSQEDDTTITVELGLDHLETALDLLKDIAEEAGLTFAFAWPGEGELAETCAFADDGEGPQVWRVNLATT